MVSSPPSISPEKLRSDLYSGRSETPPLVISVLASLIERAVARNKRLAVGGERREEGGARVFECRKAPKMTVKDYLERIHRYTGVGPSVYVVAYVYIDRFCELLPEFRVNAGNIHGMLITAITVASKYVEDVNYRNSYLAKVGRLRTEDLNRMEMEMVFSMRFKLHVKMSVFESYCVHLEREVGVGGGYQIERTLRNCAEEIAMKSGGGEGGNALVLQFL